MSVPPRASPRPPGQRHPRLDSLKNPLPRPRPRIQKEVPDRCINPDCTEPTVLIVEDAKLVCESCGTVADDSPDLVTDLQYGLDNGRHVVHGHRVGAESGYARNADMRDGNRQTTSLEQSNMAGKEYAAQICNALQINLALQEAGMQVFRLASSINFIQGRRTKSVAAVALYIACRSQRENPNHYMLIDFSDVLQLNVFSLGQIYTDLVKELRMNPNGTIINEINPEDLILRFAQRSEFGSETMRVANDAVRIVQRMKRDWMTPGRRPAGICGAALILAARMNNFRRTAREMVYIVKVNEMTIFKRLEEFKVLESSGLTVEEFRTIDLERNADPPAFYQNKDGKKKRKRKRKHVEFDDDGDDLGNSPNSSRAVTETPVEAPNNQLRTPANTQQSQLDSRMMPPPPVPVDPSLLSDSTPDLRQSTPTSSRIESRDNLSIEPSVETQESANDTSQTGGSGPSPSSTRTPSSSLPPTDLTSKPPAKRKRGRPPKERTVQSSEDDVDIAAALTDPFDFSPSALQSAVETATRTIPTPAQSQSADAPLQPPRDIPTSTTIGDDEFDDDPEVMNCLLGPDEVAIKTRIWTSMNADWLRLQAAKKLKHEIAVSNGTFKPRKTRQRRRRRIGDLRQYASELGEGWEQRLESGEGLADSAAEAVGIMMKRRAYSHKINYEALKEVYTPSSSGSRRTSIGGAGSPGSGVNIASPRAGVGGEMISPERRESRIDEEEGQVTAGATEVGEVRQTEIDSIVGELEEGGIYYDDEDEDEDDDDEDAQDDGNDDDDDPYDAGGAVSD